MRKFLLNISPFLVLLLLILLWQFVCEAGFVASYMLPSPSQIFFKLFEKSDTLFSASLLTIQESILGLIFGVGAGFIVAMVLDRFKIAKRALLPLLNVSQTIPVIAIAPLIVLILGFGILPKVVLVALMTFFPVAVACVGGFSTAPKETLEMAESCGASWIKTFFCVKVPWCAKTFFDACKISVTYAFSGAVIAEWLGGDVGLGVLMTRARKSFDMTTLFACVVIIVFITIIFVQVVKLSESRLMKWRRYDF